MITSSEMFDNFKTLYPKIKKPASWFKSQMILNGLIPDKHTKRGDYHNKIVYQGVKNKEFTESREGDMDTLECKIVDLE